MAELLDLPRPLYNAFEQGRFKLPDEKVEILCHYFNVTEEYLCAEGE
ncbi:MAG: helix-turn-helix transcriptional regulator [Clostridia bacterium]|nr:helix-turn-helix transcriptional regulator [Clostridia bacterium]